MRKNELEKENKQLKAKIELLKQDLSLCRGAMVMQNVEIEELKARLQKTKGGLK